MRRKRLQHLAQNLAQMFCGWQLLPDYGILTRLGNGILEIDVLERSCRFNGEPIKPLVMAKVLNSWMQEDLQDHGIPLESIRAAVVQVEFTTRHTNKQQILSGVWAKPSRHFVLCDLNCRGRVSTDERIYEGEYRELEEWPFEVAV
jgi:hypothetical protein